MRLTVLCAHCGNETEPDRLLLTPDPGDLVAGLLRATVAHALTTAAASLREPAHPTPHHPDTDTTGDTP